MDKHIYTIEEMKQMLASLIISQKETDKKFQETDKKFQETKVILNTKFQATDKKFQATDEKFQATVSKNYEVNMILFW